MSFKRRQLTNVEILEIFNNSDNEYESQESDSDSEEMPPNLVAIENPESEDPLSTDKVPGPFEDAGGDGGRPAVDEVQEFCGSWKATSHFTPPGPAVCFDESQSGVQRLLPFPSEAECFRLFLTEELMGDIVEETNRYALELQEKREPGVRGKLTKWETTTISEMDSKEELPRRILEHRSYVCNSLLCHPLFPRPPSSASMPAFRQQCYCHPKFPVIQNKKCSIQPDISIWSGLCESLLLWEGRLAFRQYIPSKRHRLGVKFFVMCDVTSTTDIQHYEGLRVSGSVVMTMLAPHLSKGHTLYVDNWYSSPTLFQHLLSNITGACGTVRSNRKGMPAFGCRKMLRGEGEFKENGQQLAVKLHDKRDVSSPLSIQQPYRPQGRWTT